MADDVPSDIGPMWLTYRAAAARTGLPTTAIRCRSRRGRWPKRLLDDSETEVLVPAELLAKGPKQPKEGREPSAQPVEPQAIAATEQEVLQAQIDALRSELFAALVAIPVEVARADELQRQIEVLQARQCHVLSGPPPA